MLSVEPRMSHARLERLREKLLHSGRPSYPPGALTSLHPKPELAELLSRVRPFAEAMYLVLAADSDLGGRERDALRGALRILTEGMLSQSDMDALLRALEAARAREGTALRLDAVASALYGDRSDAELALHLAVAATRIDGRLDTREQAMVFALAARLGIPVRKTTELLYGDLPGSEA